MECKVPQVLLHMKIIFWWNECYDFTPNMPVFAGDPVGITSKFREVQHECDYFMALFIIISTGSYSK